ncbi:MAG TPA: phosphonate C-P lyase system protein PhnG [Rhodospirillaceae bacterium]|nr:phosphonate C-P lyase system protein PhnG [Rhodospirillaceae bacterium]
MREAANEQRRRWMSVLAKAEASEIEDAWSRLRQVPAYIFLRRPETGLVMVRARAGGDGRPFNFGEMTVTRCSVRLDDGMIGHAYVAGRNARHAELAAALDALLQDDGRGRALRVEVIHPLAAAQERRRMTEGRKAAATKVDFFTVKRGEDQ